MFSKLMSGLAAGLLLTGAVHAASLKVSCAAVGQELELCKSAIDAWVRKTGHTVTVVVPPANASERLAQYQQQFKDRSSGVDVLQIDAAWTGLLQEHLIDLKPHSGGVEQKHLGGVIANNTVAGRLVAMPWFIDAGLLYYRKDLLDKHGLKAPRTWEELAQSAKTVQQAERAAGNKAMWGYVWQGRNYEGLTCNALEWLVSHGGGSFVDQGGRVTVRNSQATRALAQAASWVGTISPPEVLNFAEDESFAMFKAGNAVFMRNWPYAWSLSQAAGSAVKGKIGITVLPKAAGSDGRYGATLGGQQLAVSKYSTNVTAAADLVMYMTSAGVQKERAIAGSFNPTLWPLYADREILKATPFMGELFGVLAFATARPSNATGVRYREVSQSVATTVHDVLSGKLAPEDGINKLNAELLRIGQNGKWN
jgi:trehalose/maltose transport system substrate-binding protein